MTQSAFAAAELAGKYKRLIGFLVQRGQAVSPNAAGIAHIWNPLARFRANVVGTAHQRMLDAYLPCLLSLVFVIVLSRVSSKRNRSNGWAVV